MVRRRTAFNPLETTAAPRWYVVRSMHGTVTESRLLPGGADLKREIIVSMLAWIDAGWELSEFSSVSGTFFCNRNPERRMVSIDTADPNDSPIFGSGYFGGCPTCRD
jgi:hypothetical protein